MSSNQYHDNVFQGEMTLFPKTPPPPPHLPSSEADRGINKGWFLFLLYVLSVFLLCFICVFWLFHMQFSLYSVYPPPLPLRSASEDGGIKKGWLLFFCMCCLCFGFVLLDCCIFGRFSCNFTLFSLFLLLPLFHP